MDYTIVQLLVFMQLVQNAEFPGLQNIPNMKTKYGQEIKTVYITHWRIHFYIYVHEHTHLVWQRLTVQILRSTMILNMKIE